MVANQMHQGIGMTSQRTRSRLVARLAQAGIKDQRVLDVMEALPRHCFVDEALAHRAYEDSALPIGLGQTISQPYIVAKMTEMLLANGSSEKMKSILEIGTGCGYQTAILAHLASEVVTLERIAGLQVKAKARLAELNISNVEFHHCDGWQGFPASAPYGGILVAAAPNKIPDALLQQLNPERGRLVIPVGDDRKQDLLLVERNGEHFKKQVIEAVRFVPLVEGDLI